MPKTKKINEMIEKIDLKKPIVKDDEEKELDPDLILPEGETEQEIEEEEELLDDDEINPFHDKWEE